MENTLRGFGMCFTTSINVACPRPKNYKLRVDIVTLISVVLTVSSILFLRQGYFPIQYTTLPTWDWLMLVFAYTILAFLLFVAIRDWGHWGKKSATAKACRGYDAYCGSH